MRGITENAIKDIYEHIKEVLLIITIEIYRVFFLLKKYSPDIAGNQLTLQSNFQNPERDFVLKVSALEIYNESVADLLNHDSGPLRLLDDPEVLKCFYFVRKEPF